MPTYSYRAKDERGAPATGSIEAASREDAVAKLRAERKIVIDLEEGVATANVEQARLRQAARGVKREEVIAFSSQMAVMLETGVPLTEAIHSFIASTRSAHLKKVMAVVNERLHGGASLSTAMQQFPKVFPNLMVTLMKAAELSGTMALMLRRISEYLGKERRTKKQITGAMTYPMVMITMAVAVTLFLVVWVLPRFAKIYASRSATLPLPTRIVMSISDALIHHWAPLLGGVAAVTAAFVFIRTTTRGRRALDWLKLKLPVVGPMMTQYYLTRSSRTLATLLASGVSLIDGVRIIRGVTNNVLWVELWDKMIESMTGGLTIGEVASKSKLIPPPVASMMAAAERTGRLPETLERIAEVAEDDLEEAIKTGSQLIEPAMIAVMGALIGGVAIALLLPIFSIGTVMSQ